MYRTILAYTGGRADIAEEAVGEAFARASAQGDSLRDPAAWLYRVAFNVANDEVRRERRERTHPPSESQPPHEVAGLFDALKQLPPRERAVMALFYVLDLPVSEVASRLGIASATVRRASHARTPSSRGLARRRRGERLMPKRWERELRRLGDVPAPTERIHARSTRPSEARQSDGMPPTRQRVLAGVVAFGVFIAAAAFGWQAFSGGRSPAQPGVANDWPLATVTLSSGEAGRSAVLSIGGRAQEGVFGTTTSPDEDYPYRWSNPPIDQAIAVPIGAELRLDGDVQIKEILFGDADELDAGRGPDSGPISSEQPTFEEPYFPVQDQPRREYWKLFGTWADGSVLDVYFEVRWVEPRVDLSDTSVDIVVTPATLEADLLYGG